MEMSAPELPPAMIILFGPISSAAPNGGSSFWNWFEIIVAGCVLVTGWGKYLNRDPNTNVASYNLVGLTVICAIMIGFGVWDCCIKEN